MIRESLKIIALEEGKGGASLEELIELVRYTDQSSYFERMQELKPFWCLALQFIPIDEVIHALIGDMLAASENQRA